MLQGLACYRRTQTVAADLVLRYESRIVWPDHTSGLPACCSDKHTAHVPSPHSFATATSADRRASFLDPCAASRSRLDRADERRTTHQERQSAPAARGP